MVAKSLSVVEIKLIEQLSIFAKHLPERILVCLGVGTCAPYTPFGFAYLLIGAVIWGSNNGGDIGITPVP
jgi:hypothetical protein